MGSISQEPLRDSIARGDGVVRFKINAFFEKHFLDPKGFKLYGKGTEEVATSVTREGNQIAVRFSRPLVTGDKIGC